MLNLKGRFLMKTLYVLFSSIVLFSICFFSCRTLNITSSNEKIGLSPSKVIFTFDDGPNHHNNTTERLLDVLNKYQVKGVFCLIGVNVENNPEIVRRMYNEGHIIVNHGYSDKLAYFMDDNEFRENLLLGERAITEALGFELYPKLYRPQGGIYKPSQQRIINEEGFVVVPFTINVMDPYAASDKKDKITKRIIENVEKQNGGVILLHDGRDGYERNTIKIKKNPNSAYNRSWIPETVEEIIIALLDKGFILNETFDFNY
jgi:peptidoglycan/xylan/chitin deacetylase (PgdA/CDA1 family)